MYNTSRSDRVTSNKIYECIHIGVSRELKVLSLGYTTVHIARCRPRRCNFVISTQRWMSTATNGDQRPPFISDMTPCKQRRGLREANMESTLVQYFSPTTGPLHWVARWPQQNWKTVLQPKGRIFYLASPKHLACVPRVAL